MLESLVVKLVLVKLPLISVSSVSQTDHWSERSSVARYHSDKPRKYFYNDCRFVAATMLGILRFCRASKIDESVVLGCSEVLDVDLDPSTPSRTPASIATLSIAVETRRDLLLKPHIVFRSFSLLVSFATRGVADQFDGAARDAAWDPASSEESCGGSGCVPVLHEFVLIYRRFSNEYRMRTLIRETTSTPRTVILHFC